MPAPRHTPSRPASLLVESQTSPAGRSVSAAYHLATSGEPVVVFLIDAGVQEALDCSPAFKDLQDVGVRVWVDDVSLSQRDVPPADLAPGVEVVTLDEVAASLFDPAVKVVWH